MSDYRKHQYSYLFAYIEDEVNRLGEDKDYASLLLSMERAVSLDELVSIYNEILIFSASTLLGKALPENWYKITWLQANMTWLFENLNLYLNENIVRLLSSYKSPTYDQAIASLANIRECPNSIKFKNQILNVVNTIDDEEEFDKVYSTMTHQCSQRRIVEKYGLRSQKENNALLMYVNDSKLLAAHCRIFDIIEIAFGKVHRITYEGFANDYYKDQAKFVEKRIVGELLKSDKSVSKDDILNAIDRAKAKEMDEVMALISQDEIEEAVEIDKQKLLKVKKKKREVRKAKIRATILAALIVIPIFLGLIIIIEKIGLLGIIIIIGFIGAIPKLLMTGKF